MTPDAQKPEGDDMGLGARCPCGHLACYHPSAKQQDIQLQRSGGRYPGECKGGTAAHCRCVTSREEVSRG